MMKILRLLCVLILIFPLAMPSTAQASKTTEAFSLKQYKINHWTTDDGLASNTLLKLYEDKKGYLWISSYDGITRFDGSEFITYTKSSGLPSSQVQGLIGDSHGNLWIGTGAGLVKYSQGKFVNVAGEHDLFIQTFWINEDDHQILIGTRGDGLHTYDYNTNQYVKIESPYTKDIIRSILKDSKGNTWVGSEKVGLSLHSNGQWKTYSEKDGLTNREINSLYLDGQDQLYVGTNAGMFLAKDGKFIDHPMFSGKIVNGIDKDSNGNLWVLTNTGIYRQNSQDDSWEELTKADGLSNNDIQNILFDSEGSIWITTYRGGLHQLSKSKFKTYSIASGLESDEVSAVEELEENEYIVGSIDGKLSVIDHGKTKPLFIKTIIGGRIYDILSDKNKNVWVTTRAGLLLLKPDGQEKFFTEKDGLPEGQLWTILEQKDKSFLIGSRTGGMMKMDFKSYPDKPVFTDFKRQEVYSDFIMSIKETRKGDLIICTNTSGIDIISANGNVKHYGKKEGLNSNVVFNSYADKDGAIWLATTEGLSYFKDDKFFNYTYKDGLPFESILDVMEDEQNQLWIPTGIGIVRVSKKELLDYKDGNIQRIYWKVFNRNDGMKKPQCTGASLALKASNGSLWFPTFGGIVSVDPRTITLNETPPKVYLEKFIVDDTDVDLTKTINLPAGSHRIVFHYTALSLLNPNSAKYRYRLENFDPDWVEAGDQRQAVYTRLKNGTYSFKVMACNNDGIWNTVGASADFVVQPYYYQTRWFATLLVAVFILIVFTYSKWRTNTISKKSILLEKEVQKRTEELREKTKEIEQKNEHLKAQNEEITGMINIVAHDLRAPLNKITGLTFLLGKEGEFNEQQKEYLQYIETVTQHGNLLVRDLLDVHSFEYEDSKPTYSQIDLKKFMEGWQRSAEQELQRKQQQLHTSIDIHQQTINCDQIFLTRILDNLFTNASKFSQKGKNIFVSISQNGSSINVSVRDEGPGISQADQKKMFKRFQKLSARPTAGESSNGLGLAIIKTLTEKLGGTIIVKSEVGLGTEFIVHLPLNSNG